MKKIILLAVAFATVSLVSCKKDRTCECTTTTTQTNGTTTTGNPSTTTYKKVKKSDATYMCQKSTYKNVDDNGTYTSVSDCKLK